MVAYAPWLTDLPLTGRSVQEPYPNKDRIQNKRYQAQKRNSTTYVYDYVDLFREAVAQRWRAYASANPSADVPSGNRAFSAIELVIGRDDQLVEDRRAPGNNDVGMVAWKLTMRTPEAPNGREMIVIANDITFVSGSFSPKEDKVFKLASQLARAQGLPRLYIAVNSGARIGLAKEIMDRFKVRQHEKGLGDAYSGDIEGCSPISSVLLTNTLLLGGLVLGD